MSSIPIALRLTDVHAGYGPIRALHGVSFEVREGGIVVLLGANGAGKSTTLRVISGLLAPTEGTVEYLGEDVKGREAGWLVRRGLIHVPEGRRIFADFTVEENLKIGGYTAKRAAFGGAMEEVFEYFPLLRERRKQAAGTLSGGEQQMLAIGRGLMADPKVLLLDEPSLGLAPLIVSDIYRIIGAINKERRVTVLIVEQNAAVALNVADFAYVLETGRVAVQGRPENIRGNEDIRRSYLGY
ncbi:MAG: ATP-binding cassette domain-containing protein [Dehalococcoidia bacterium]|nr:ATP-binding cassette domain-containing protein [Dehalococcoidia bacterium]